MIALSFEINYAETGKWGAASENQQVVDKNAERVSRKSWRVSQPTTKEFTNLLQGDGKASNCVIVWTTL